MTINVTIRAELCICTEQETAQVVRTDLRRVQTDKEHQPLLHSHSNEFLHFFRRKSIRRDLFRRTKELTASQLDL